MKADVKTFTCGEIINVNIYKPGNHHIPQDKLELVMHDKLS